MVFVVSVVFVVPWVAPLLNERHKQCFGKPCLCPLPKRGRFDESGENDEFAFYPLKTGFPSENNENDENGRCRSGKGMV